jgi:hypothetical protein
VLLWLDVDCAVVRLVLYFLEERGDFYQYICFEIHKPLGPTNKVVIVVFDVMGQARVNETQDIGQIHVFKCWRQFLICLQLMVSLPGYDVSSDTKVGNNQVPVFVVKIHSWLPRLVF